jgi:ATP-dependent Clp protease ATP-binding subunit ClpA
VARFLRSGRATVAAAAEAARALGAERVGTEHLLLALAPLDRFGWCGPAGLMLPKLTADAIRAAIAPLDEDAEALAALGISVDEIRGRVEAEFGPEAWEGRPRRRGRLRFDDDAKEALELAFREAIDLRHRRIGQEHILLGLLRQNGRACRLLESLGVAPDELRGAMLVRFSALVP